MRCNQDRKGYLEFDKVARVYDSIRPGYPEELYRKILDYADLSEDANLLEIGCGTGQATIFFAKAGFNILSLDPGINLLTIAKQKLLPYPAVTFSNTKFEDAELPIDSFGLVFSATAFHWIEPSIAYKKAADVLEPGGTLALFWNLMPEPDIATKQKLSVILDNRRAALSESAFGHGDRSRTINEGLQELTQTGLFADIEHYLFDWQLKMTPLEFTDLLSTFSNFQSLPKVTADTLYADIEGFIREDLEGEILLNYSSILNLARKIK